MIRALVLGPSQWERSGRVPSPFYVREEIAGVFRDHGHEAILMEQVEDQPGEGLAEKFLRLLDDERVTHIVVYWPADAKIPTTLAELVALRFLAAQRSIPGIWLLHEDAVADASTGSFNVRVREGKIAYLRDLVSIGVRAIPWKDTRSLYGLVGRLVQEFTLARK